MSDQNLLVKPVKRPIGLPTNEPTCCGDVLQAPEETVKQDDKEKPADTSSCCNS